MMKMPPDDAYALRKALEPLTVPCVESEGNELALTSIAISLKRIADAMEPKVVDEERGAPVVTFAGDGTGDMLVRHPAWGHGIKIMKGVVLIMACDLQAAAVHGWQSMPRATTPQETEAGLIRVFKI